MCVLQDITRIIYEGKPNNNAIHKHQEESEL